RRAEGVPDGALALVADVGDEAAVESAMAKAVGELGGLQGVATCAGVFVPGDGKPAGDVALDDFLSVLQTNLVGTFLAVKYALPHLVRDGGAVVTVASTAAVSGHGHGSGYTASKGAVTALTRLFAVQYGRHGVRANCICPGAFDTAMTKGAYNSPESKERMKRTVPVGRVGEPAEIASTIAFLLSDDASYLTGSTLIGDG